MHDTTDNEQSPTLTLVCSRHGAQRLAMYSRDNMSLLLKCGCSYSLERMESDYEGNVFDRDCDYRFEDLDAVIDELLEDL